MKNLESFLEKYESNLDRIVIAGGWAIEIFQDRIHDPRREHHDVDTLVLDESLDVEGDSHNVLGEYFGSIDVESVDWLLDFIVEKQVVCKGKAYDVKVLCPEFIAVSKAFSKMGEAREKDNEDIKHLFKTVNLDREKIFSLMEKAYILIEGSNFLDMLIEKGFEATNCSIYDFNKKLFQKKFSFEKIPEQISNKNIRSYDLLFSQIKKGLGTGWIKNHKKQIKKLLTSLDAKKAENYGLAIRDALVYAGEDIKKYITGKMLSISDADEVRIYGLAVWNALSFAEEDMQKNIADKLLDIPDAKKAMSYGCSIRYALEYAGDGMKEGLVDKMLGIPDAEKARDYGLSICDALIGAGKDMKTQQQIISNIFEDS